MFENPRKLFEQASAVLSFDDNMIQDFHWKRQAYSEPLSRAHETLRSFRRFLGTDIFAETLASRDETLSLVQELESSLSAISTSLEQAAKAKGLFGSRKRSRAAKNADAAFVAFILKSKKAKQLIASLENEYFSSVRDKQAAVKTQHPYLEIVSEDDFAALQRIQDDPASRAIFHFLDKKIFPYFRENSLPLERLTILLSELRNQQKYHVYFLNVQRYLRFLTESARKRRKLFDEREFLNQDAFLIFEMFSLFAIHSLDIMSKLRLSVKLRIDKGKGMLPVVKEEGKYKLTSANWFIQAKHFTETEDSTRIQSGILALRRLSSSNILFEEEMFASLRLHVLLTDLTPDMVELLILARIRKIHNNEELDDLLNLKGLFSSRNGFRDERGLLSQLWKHNVSKNAKNLHFFAIFLACFSSMEKEMRILFGSPYILSGSDLFRLEVLAKDSPEKFSWQEFFRKPGRGRKIVLVTAPKEDFDLSFKELFREAQALSTENFDIHFAFISSTQQLAYAIREAGSSKPLDAVVISGHGLFGLGTRLGYDKSDVGGGLLLEPTESFKKLSAVKKYLSPECKIFMASCSAGGGGTNTVAHSLAKILERTVIAPQRDTFGHLVQKDGEAIVAFSEGIPILRFEGDGSYSQAA